MWTRKELKEKGKSAFKRNYWKTVLVSLLFAIVVSGAPFSSVNAGRSSADEAFDVTDEEETSVPDILSELDHYDEAELMAEDDIDTLPAEFADELDGFRDSAGGIATTALVAGLLLLFVVLFVVLLLAQSFLFNPLHAGMCRFFVRNLNTTAEVKELAYCYDHGYLNSVKTILLKNVYIFLWTLLLIVPGIVKAYQYRMVEYILAENPEMSTKEVLAKSRAMMKGNKWKAFVLDLSFIGWYLLAVITLGIVGIFYVGPYKQMTNAALYEFLEYGKNEGEVVVWTES